MNDGAQLPLSGALIAAIGIAFWAWPIR